MLCQAGGTTLPVSGSANFSTTLNSITITIKAIVVKDLHKNLLISWQDLIALLVINSNFPKQLDDTACSASSENFNDLREKIVYQFQDTLSGDLSPDPMEILGKAMHIYLQPNAVPSQILIARLLPLHMQQAATQVSSDLL